MQVKRLILVGTLEKYALILKFSSIVELVILGSETFQFHKNVGTTAVY
ncbi:hypothetical protein LEP1GSC021_1267 [Leptospira noguchii str. 1993005606]|nr:hypothetical protein LEP1GSC021_1267 [Leptospira noguchii str. 1993005606]